MKAPTLESFEVVAVVVEPLAAERVMAQPVLREAGLRYSERYVYFEAAEIVILVGVVDNTDSAVVAVAFFDALLSVE
jgi:hypothetical protein